MIDTIVCATFSRKSSPAKEDRLLVSFNATNKSNLYLSWKREKDRDVVIRESEVGDRIGSLKIFPLNCIKVSSSLQTYWQEWKLWFKVKRLSKLLHYVFYKEVCMDSIENFLDVKNSVEKHTRWLLVVPFVGNMNRDVNFSGFKYFNELSRAVHNANMKSVAVVIENHVIDDIFVQFNVILFDDGERCLVGIYDGLII